ncbi:AtpZ/AtpI family protein [Paenibacillus sp. R14(2021)]|uniref:AtpZ/AtpI family protein n=1 Tax=Paenibacillus sp. R14(2021) TaxID=2859228 RepID=UPI001C61193C|nr:AtpZ/AtpI family protein [Paenibacillus sp. R14(2021)]
MNSSHNDNNRNTGNDSLGDNPWRAMGLIGSVGGTIGVCLGLGYWIGSKIDRAQGTEYGAIIGMAAGFIIAAVIAILLIRTFTGGKTKA